jgi:hypothetical protein
VEAPPGSLADIDALTALGRRAPGSDAERRAARHLAARLTALGRDVEVQAIEIWPGWPLAYAASAALSIVASVLSVSSPLPGAALALTAALLTFLDAGLLIPTIRRALGRRASQNVVSWGDRAKPGLLILVAHHDAGRGGLALSPRARALPGPFGPARAFFWAQLAVLACCLVRLPGLEGVALTAVQFIPTALLVVAVALLIDIALAGTKGGENDNASGVALALRLAERLTGNLEHFDLHLLLCGGQKAGAAGTRAFLKRHGAELPRERTVFLNIDEVGSGGVRYTAREGALTTTRSHPQLVQLCREIAEDDATGAQAIVNRSASDAHAARAAGFAAITVTCRGRRDLAGMRVEEDAIERAEAFCAELIARVDAELGPGLTEEP